MPVFLGSSQVARSISLLSLWKGQPFVSPPHAAGMLMPKSGRGRKGRDANAQIGAAILTLSALVSSLAIMSFLACSLCFSTGDSVAVAAEPCLALVPSAPEV